MRKNSCRAWQDTRKSLGWNPKTIILAVVLYLIGFIVYWMWQGWEEMIRQVITEIAFGLIPIVLALVIVFLFHLVRAPVFIKYEAEIKKLQDAMDKEHAVKESLEKYKRDMAPIESMYNAAQQAEISGDVSYYLDFRVVKMYWKGLGDNYIADPYIVVQCMIPSRLVFDSLFTDIHKIPFTLAILDEKAKDEKDRRLQIAAEASLVWFENMQTEKTMEPNGECKITNLHPSNDCFFRFGGFNSDTRNWILSRYTHSESQEIPKIKVEFNPKLLLKTVPDSLPVTFNLRSPISKEFCIDI